jgi:hypothetical protein
MMKSVTYVFAVLLAASASLAVAQTNPPVANCDPTGCWGTDGTRYTRGAGNLMFGSNGKTCQFVAPGTPLTCN